MSQSVIIVTYVISLVAPSTVRNIKVSAHSPFSLFVEWEQPLDPGCPSQDLTYDVIYQVSGPVNCQSKIVDDINADGGSRKGITQSYYNITNLHPYSVYVVKVVPKHTIAGAGSPVVKNATTLNYGECLLYFSSVNLTLFPTSIGFGSLSVPDSVTYC